MTSFLDNAPKPSTREFDDVNTARQAIYDGVIDAYGKSFPIENTQYKLSLDKLQYGDVPSDDLAHQKKAIVEGHTVHRPLHGQWTLTDKVTGEIVDQQKGMIARVPHMTQRGTFIYNGNEWSLASQMRLKPGVYTRRRETGELESHFNIMPGSGQSFRVSMDPDTGIFKVRVGQGSFPMYPMLNSLGVPDKDIQAAWGNKLFEINHGHDDVAAHKAYEKFVGHKLQPDGSFRDDLNAVLTKMQLDPVVTRHTLGEPHDHVTPETLLAATRRIMNINQGKEDPDDRDHVAYQMIMGPEDLFRERVARDAGGTSRQLLYKATWKRNLKPIVSTNARTKQLQSVLLDSGLGMPLEESNPLDIHDQLFRISRMGTGGIPSVDAIPDESKAVQPSYLGFIDPIRTSKSEKVGVDNRLAFKTVKGKDNRLYVPLRNKMGKEVLVSSVDAGDATIAFPGELAAAKAEGRPVRAMVNGKMRMVSANTVDYELPSHEAMFSPTAFLVPFLGAINGQRMMMTSGMFAQALPLVDREAPLVQTARDDGSTFEQYFGNKAGAVRSTHLGVVKAVKPDEMTIRTNDGKTVTYPMYNYMPFNRRTFVHNTPTVQPGDEVRPGQLLATSNYTTPEGTLALGRNLRVAFMPWKGLTFEDAIVISKSAASKLTSEHAYQMHRDIEPDHVLAKKTYLTQFPVTYKRELLDKRIGDDGIILPGTTVHKGDPLVLSMSKTTRRGIGVPVVQAKIPWRDNSMTWDYDVPGTVTDVFRSPSAVNVVIRAQRPAEVGDKMVNRHASKGVISSIVPDEQMPHTKDGQPMEVLMHPFGVISRTNPSVLLDASLGKLAAKTGKVQAMPSFQNGSFVEDVYKKLKKAGLEVNEDLIDPSNGARMPNVFVGNQFFMRLHHLAESKLGERGEGAGYTMDQMPSKAGDEVSKRVGNMEVNALLSAGAVNVLRDSKLIRGQRNDAFWRAFRLGYPPPTPDVPFVYRKFMDDLKAAGVNVVKKGNYTHIMAMTDKDIDKMSRGEIKKSDTLDYNSMDPIPGGLFDLGKTGGHRGTGWSHFELKEPMPNPVMEESIRRLLGITEKTFRGILSGELPIGENETGGTGLRNALARINIDKELANVKAVVADGPASKRDPAIKKWQVLAMFKKTGLKPADLMWTKVPVMPPEYRPIARTSKFMIETDPNRLYKEVMEANNHLGSLTKELGVAGTTKERIGLYDSMKALVGLGDPVQAKLQQQKVRGILGHALGIGASPKHSDFQRKVISTPVDLAGRGVIVPNPALDMDHVGIPADMAWTIYRPFIIRGLTQKGLPAVEAVKHTLDRHPDALAILQSEMTKRPIIMNRAPTLHRYGIMAAYPIMTAGKTIEVSPITTKGFGADFDGDAEQIHVPVSQDAVREAIDKLMPSRNLTNVRFFDIHYKPDQEYLHGLYEGTTPNKSKGPARRFASKQDAIAAFRRGELRADEAIITQ